MIVLTITVIPFCQFNGANWAKPQMIEIASKIK